MEFIARPLAKTFGVELTGLDLSRELNDVSWARLRRVYLESKVVAIPSQALTAPQFAAVAERFGVIEPHVVSMFHHEDAPGITVLSNRMEMGRPKGIRDAGSHWHSDYSYKSIPAEATLLYALEVPEDGGDTLFADLSAAYDALPDETKKRLERRSVRHQYRWHRDQNHPEARWLLLSEQERAATPPVVHPLVRRHPETGAKSIYAFPGITSGVVGIEDMPAAESDALLESLYAHCAHERFQFRYR
jgi:taurine dioxygenase